MSDRAPTSFEQRVFEQRVLPVVFPHPPADGEPLMLFVLGQPGTGVGRTAGGLIAGRQIAALSAPDLRAFHPRYAELSRDRSPEASRLLAESASGWMRGALQHARTTRRSLVLDGTLSSPDIALATTGLFGGAGFHTTVVVVGVPPAESLLAATSKYLLDVRSGRASQLTTVREHDRGFENTRALVQTLEATPSADRLTIVGRDGTTRFDASRTDPAGFAGARAALDREHATPLPAHGAMRWLSELRAMTDYALSSRQVPRPLTDVLIELHEIGLREILPGLPLPKDSQARPAAEASLGRRLVAVRQAAEAERRPERRTGPVVSAPEPDRGISI